MTSIFKYIILREPTGEERPILFHRELQHSHCLPEHKLAVSAGHVVIYKGHILVPAIGSETLHLNPRPQDRDLLADFLGQTDRNSKPPASSGSVPLPSQTSQISDLKSEIPKSHSPIFAS